MIVLSDNKTVQMIKSKELMKLIFIEIMDFRKLIIYSFFISIITFSSCDKEEPSNDTFANDIVGMWVYAWSYYQDGQEITKTETYIFDKDGRGCGPIIDSSYDFSYEILNEDDGFHTLVIKYENSNEIEIFKEAIILNNSLRLNNNLYKRQ